MPVAALGLVNTMSSFGPNSPYVDPPRGGPAAPTSQRLGRPAQGRVIAGVCAGIARWLNAEPVMVRGVLGILCLVTAILPGAIAYIILLMLMPDEAVAGQSAFTGGFSAGPVTPVGGGGAGGGFEAPRAAPLTRSRTDRKVSGLCAGLAQWLGWDPSALRVAVVALAVLSAGTLLLIYLLAWLIVPEEPRAAAPGAHSRV